MFIGAFLNSFLTGCMGSGLESDRLRGSKVQIPLCRLSASLLSGIYFLGSTGLGFGFGFVLDLVRRVVDRLRTGGWMDDEAMMDGPGDLDEG